MGDFDPSSWAKSENSLDLNGGPLSVQTCFVVQWWANVFLSFILVGLIPVEDTVSTSGYRPL